MGPVFNHFSKGLLFLYDKMIQIIGLVFIVESLLDFICLFEFLINSAERVHAPFLFRVQIYGFHFKNAFSLKQAKKVARRREQQKS